MNRRFPSSICVHLRFKLFGANLKLAELLLNSKETFRQKFIEALAKKTSLTPEQAAAEHKDYIEQYVNEKHKPVQQLVERINESKIPVFLNIRRDRTRISCSIIPGTHPEQDILCGSKEFDGVEISGVKGGVEFKNLTGGEIERVPFEI